MMWVEIVGLRDGERSCMIVVTPSLPPQIPKKPREGVHKPKVHHSQPNLHILRLPHMYLGRLSNTIITGE
jgi:hypothetical protein